MGEFFHSTWHGLVLQEVKKWPNLYAKIDGHYVSDVEREHAWQQVLESVKRQKNIRHAELGGNFFFSILNEKFINNITFNNKESSFQLILSNLYGRTS